MRRFYCQFDVSCNFYFLRFWIGTLFSFQFFGRTMFTFVEYLFFYGFQTLCLPVFVQAIFTLSCTHIFTSVDVLCLQQQQQMPKNKKKTKKSQIQNFNYSNSVPGNDFLSRSLFGCFSVPLRLRWLKIFAKYLGVLSNDTPGKRQTTANKKRHSSTIPDKDLTCKTDFNGKKLLFWLKVSTFVQRVFCDLQFYGYSGKQMEKNRNAHTHTHTFWHHIATHALNEWPHILLLFGFAFSSYRISRYTFAFFTIC